MFEALADRLLSFFLAVAIFFPGAAIVALLLAVLGLAAPQSFFDLADPVLSVYAGNELLFLAGFLFAIGHQEGD